MIKLKKKNNLKTHNDDTVDEIMSDTVDTVLIV